MSFLHRPKHVWWRKAIFQVHLWGSIVLCLYLTVIGFTGSLLVFESELEHAAWAPLWKASVATHPQHSVDFPSVVHTVLAAYPGAYITAAYAPDKQGNNFEFFVFRGQEIRYVFIDAETGCIVGAIDPAHSWLVKIVDLHFRLLAGKTGLIINGIGAAGLLLLCATGIVVWWSGLRRWTRGLKVNLKANWRRINFDLHSVVGFWTLAILTMWAFTGVYFVWPKPIESFVNRFSSVASANPPVFQVSSRGTSSWNNLGSMIRTAQQTSPNAQFAGAFFPYGNSGALTLLMARGEPRNFTQMDYIYFDPATGKQLALWHRGVTDTWGGKFIFWLSPLHFGYNWGLAVKFLWAVLGCALPLPSITGVLMYWNRSLSKRWRVKRKASPLSPKPIKT